MRNNEIPDPFDSNDYFEPQKFFLDMQVPTGNLYTQFNPKLSSVGDFVVRTLFERLSSLMVMLTEQARKNTNTKRRIRKHPSGLDLASRAIEDLREMCMSGRWWELCDSSVTLVQIHAAFHPAQTFGWLGFGPAATSSANLLKHRFESQHSVDLVERVAAALESLQDLFAVSIAAKDADQRIINRGGLVLLTSKKEAYWEGEQIVDGTQQLNDWKLLYLLATLRRTVSVQDFDLGKVRRTSPAAFQTYFSRLKRSVPPSLKPHLKTVRNEGYLLKLGQDEITIAPGE